MREGFHPSPEALALCDAFRDILAHLSLDLTGSTTLNELRVGNAILNAAYAGQTVTVGALALALDMNRSTVSKALDRLSIVRRSQDPQDNRRYLLSASNAPFQQWAGWMETRAQQLKREMRRRGS